MYKIPSIPRHPMRSVAEPEIVFRPYRDKAWERSPGVFYNCDKDLLVCWPSGVEPVPDPVADAKLALGKAIKDNPEFLDAIEDACGYEVGAYVVTAIEEFIK